jgi:hypothetical protein
VVRFWTIQTSNRLSDHGKSLAYALLDQRMQTQSRPIIFISHSLGGLVCEEALVFSDKREDLQSILAYTWGVIFMSTPHVGSYLAHWGDTVAKYVNIFRGTNRDILKNLQSGSSDLQRVEEDFQHMLRRGNVKLKIFCFYEALKMNDTVGKIVENWSAILSAYDSCSINADHRNMTKFNGRADAGYAQVRGVLSRWIQEYKNDGISSNTTKLAPSSGGHRDGAQRDRDASSQGGIFFYGSTSGHNIVQGTRGDTVNFNFN